MKKDILKVFKQGDKLKIHFYEDVTVNEQLELALTLLNDCNDILNKSLKKKLSLSEFIQRIVMSTIQGA